MYLFFTPQNSCDVSSPLFASLYYFMCTIPKYFYCWLCSCSYYAHFLYYTYNYMFIVMVEDCVHSICAKSF